MIPTIGKLYKIASDSIYIFQKIGLSPIRGLLTYLFLARGSGIPLIGQNVRIIYPKKLRLGRAAYVGANSFLDCCCKGNIVIGNRVTIRENAWIQARSGLNEPSVGLEIQDRVYIGPHCVIGLGGFVSIGSGTQIGARLSMSAESHVFDERTASYVGGSVSRKGITVGKNCWIGNNVTILDGVTIGDNCVIGAGSVVTKNIKENIVAYGNPCKEARRTR